MLCHDSVVYRSTRSHHSLPFPHCVSAIPIRTEMGVGWGRGLVVFVDWFASFEVVALEMGFYPVFTKLKMKD